MNNNRQYRDEEYKGTLFDMGVVLVSGEIDEILKTNERYLAEINYIVSVLYGAGQWSVLETKENIVSNEMAIKTGAGEISATYRTSRGKIRIVTESDRSCTRIIFIDKVSLTEMVSRYDIVTAIQIMNQTV